jgi:hypothetical protein
MATSTPHETFKVNINQNGVTTLATSGKYCDRNIDVNVNVPASGIIPSGSKIISANGTYDVTNFAEVEVSVQGDSPTLFTNYYDPANVSVDMRMWANSTSGITRESDTECNILKIPYHHIAGEPVVIRMRGIGTVRSRLDFALVAEDGNTRVNHYQFNSASYFTLSYDEYGDATITCKSNITSKEFYFMEFNFQYVSFSSASTALTGPIVTINEPIGNGGHA